MWAERTGLSPRDLQSVMFAIHLATQLIVPYAQMRKAIPQLKNEQRILIRAFLSSKAGTEAQIALGFLPRPAGQEAATPAAAGGGGGGGGGGERHRGQPDGGGQDGEEAAGQEAPADGAGGGQGAGQAAGLPPGQFTMNATVENANGSRCRRCLDRVRGTPAYSVGKFLRDFRL